MDKWKKIAIVFIILFVVENVLVSYLFYIGNRYATLEIHCSDNICYEMGFDSYYFGANDICYCYKDGVEKPVIEMELG